MTTPRRRTYSLRALLLAVTLLAVPLGWAAYAWSWISQRHAVLERKDIGVVRNVFSPRLSAPKGLWLLGETGVQSFHLAAPLLSAEEVDQIQKLFPEARIEYILLPPPGGF